jgi:hypothetical protein
MSLFDFFKRKKFIPQSEIINFWGGLKNLSTYQKIQNKQDIKTAYYSCPTLRAIIDTKADVFTRGNYFIIKNGEVIENHNLLKLLQQPHILHTCNQFKEDFAKSLCLYDEVFIYLNSSILGNNSTAKSIMVLDAAKMKVIASQNINIKNIISQKDIIDIFKYSDNGNTTTFLPSEVIWVTSNTPYLDGQEWKINHTIITAEQPINVIVSAYDVRNGLNRKKGGFHILSKVNPTNAEVSFNNQINEPEEVERVQNQLSQYSYSATEGYNTLVTNVDFKAQALSFPISSMELNEGIRQAKAELCDLLNFPLSVLNSLEGQTFSNVNEANKMLYQKTIIPLWDLFDSFVNETFDLKRNNEVFKTDFSHIEALQSDKKTELETKNIETKVITDLNTAINSGTITYDIAKNILINLYDYSEDEAVVYLVKKVELKPEPNEEPEYISN